MSDPIPELPLVRFVCAYWSYLSGELHSCPLPENSGLTRDEARRLRTMVEREWDEEFQRKVAAAAAHEQFFPS